jgi:hypothetical protein
MDIIDRSVDARMTSGIDNPAFIFSVFIDILKIMYTIWLLKNPDFILLVFIDIVKNMYTIWPLKNPEFIFSVFIDILKNMYTIWPLKIPDFILSIFIAKIWHIFNIMRSLHFSVGLLRQYFPNTISVTVSIVILTINVSFNRFHVPETQA